MATRLVSVDVGSGFTQYTDGKNEGAFQSIVCTAPPALGFGGEDAETVTVDGAKYLIGESAEAFGALNDRVETRHDDWAGCTGWKAALYAALVRVGVRNGDTVKLVTGLPQALYKQKKDALVKVLSGEKTFQANDKSYKINILPVVIPQATGALFYQGSKEDSIFNHSVGVIDIGTYTTGLSVVSDGRYIDRKAGGCTVGVSQLSEALKNYLEKEYGYRADLADIPKILMSKTILNRGVKIDIAPQISRQALLVARPMLDKIQALWNGGNDLLIFIAGGGAQYYEEAILSVLPHAKVMTDSFYAVVRGMLVYLMENHGPVQESNVA